LRRPEEKGSQATQEKRKQIRKKRKRNQPEGSRVCGGGGPINGGELSKSKNVE